VATAQQVAAALAELLGMKQTTPEYRYALTGNGTGADTADVGGRPGWAYIRYDDNLNRVSQIFNPRYPGIAEDVPVIVGKERPNDQYVQILTVNWAVYFERLTTGMIEQYATPKHGPTHNAVEGSDPAFMDTRNLLPGRVRQTDVATMSVYAEALYYSGAGAMAYFPGGDIDLTPYVPGTADTRRYVLVAVDADTNGLALTGGDLFPTAMTPAPPSVPISDIPLALVLVADTTTAITETLIVDYRILFSSPSGAQSAIINEIALLAESVFVLLTNHVVEGR